MLALRLPSWTKIPGHCGMPSAPLFADQLTMTLDEQPQQLKGSAAKFHGAIFEKEELSA